ncbi:MAG TPA: hypothetical protein VN887_08090 [Candidatus Angelobacter sp.]|nr:hypothetical protein [Candidatus Angelobacter sp.]
MNLNHATSEITTGSKPGIDATEKLLWLNPQPSTLSQLPPPLIEMDDAVKAKAGKLMRTT